jgi:hypothetical protein
MTESTQRRKNESVRERERSDREHAMATKQKREREEGGQKGNEEAEENYFLLFWMKTE